MAAQSSPMIYIVLGVYRPVLSLFEQQLRSILRQSHTHFQVLLTEDGPQEPEVGALVASLNDERLVRLEHSNTLGVHANYARGVEEALRRSRQGDDLFAFSDQDDVWYPEKLARQVAHLALHPACGLCHCDARVVSMAGETLAPSLFAFEQRSKDFTLLNLLVMNAVTGMTCVINKPIMHAACSFPMMQTREILHDHWLALVAAAESTVLFLDEPLVDYVQHTENELGARDQSHARTPGWNLLFGGAGYWKRCKRQYTWRANTYQALTDASTRARTLRSADITGWLGGAKLVTHMMAAWSRGHSRQAAQTWRLLAGKVLSSS